MIGELFRSALHRWRGGSPRRAVAARLRRATASGRIQDLIPGLRPGAAAWVHHLTAVGSIGGGRDFVVRLVVEDPDNPLPEERVWEEVARAVAARLAEEEGLEVPPRGDELGLGLVAVFRGHPGVVLRSRWGRALTNF